MFTGANTIAMIMLALSASARSNGALNAGYFCFQALLHAYDAAFQKKRPMVGLVLDCFMVSAQFHTVLIVTSWPEGTT